MNAIVQRNTGVAPAKPTMSQTLLCTALAGQINDLSASLEQQKENLLITAAKLGAKLAEAKDSVAGNFDGWLADNCPNVGRTNAYQYMRLAKERPHLLNGAVRTSEQQMGVSQAIALLSAPDEVKQEVEQRLEQGESVPVREIERLKKPVPEIHPVTPPPFIKGGNEGGFDSHPVLEANADLYRQAKELSEQQDANPVNFENPDSDSDADLANLSLADITGILLGILDDYHHRLWMDDHLPADPNTRELLSRAAGMLLDLSVEIEDRLN